MGNSSNGAISTWIREHGQAVDAQLWQADGESDDSAGKAAKNQEKSEDTGARQGSPPFPPRGFRPTVYDLRPELGLVEPRNPADRGVALFHDGGPTS